MSDDSYMYVFPMPDGRFGVENRSASVRYGRDPKKPRWASGRAFDSIQEAMIYAGYEAAGGEDGYPCEYGVGISPKLELKVTYEVVSLEFDAKAG